LENQSPRKGERKRKTKTNGSKEATARKEAGAATSAPGTHLNAICRKIILRQRRKRDTAIWGIDACQNDQEEAKLKNQICQLPDKNASFLSFSKPSHRQNERGKTPTPRNKQNKSRKTTRPGGIYQK
jgi:hypothetical protein